MALSLYDTYEPCSKEKAKTCKWRLYKCSSCNQIHERQGLRIFADSNIQNYYEAEPELVKKFERDQKAEQKRNKRK
jgi:hypothetical protein